MMTWSRSSAERPGTNFPPPSTTPVGDFPNDLVAGDFNSDGDDDLAVTNGGSGSLSVLTGAAGLGFAPAPGSPVALGSSGEPSIGDFDADGNQDLVVGLGSGQGVVILRGGGEPWQADSLLANGGVEGSGAAVSTSTSPAPPAPWQSTGPMTYLRYGSAGAFPRFADAARWEGGLNFFSGGPANAASSASQSVDVSDRTAAIDADWPLSASRRSWGIPHRR